MRAKIDLELCLGYGECAAVAPALFAVGDDDQSHVQGDDRDWADVRAARMAMGACPSQAITLVDDARD
jgi:ferredoxin